MIILSWLFIGLIAGWLTTILGVGSGFGLVGDIIIGICGAILGGFIVSLLISNPLLVEGLNIDNLFGALAGGIFTVMFIGVLPRGSRDEQMPESEVSPDPVLRPAQPQNYFQINGRVLIVENDQRIRQMLTMILNELGFEVTTARNGRTAFEKLQQQLFDFIILDMLQLEADGFEICSRLVTKNLPIMLIAARRDEKKIEQASQLGITHFLSKPFTEDELLRKVLALLKDRSQKTS